MWYKLIRGLDSATNSVDHVILWFHGDLDTRIIYGGEHSANSVKNTSLECGGSVSLFNASSSTLLKLLAS